jgi:adenosylmethionine-8-amino-7-oxononanoate aminotransferase
VSSVFYRDPGHEYPVAVRADGMYIYDESGDQYLDMSGGAAVSALGHGNESVIRAVQDQIARLAFAHTAFFTNGPQEELAERLAGRFSEAGARVYFSSGGSEANETALKLAWQYWQAKDRPEKSKVISRQFSYHGNTLGALSVTGSLWRRRSYENVIHDWPRIAPCYAYRHQKPGETDEAYGMRAAGELEKAINDAGADTVAAFIAEPVVGATLGAVPSVGGYFREVGRICEAYDILFIADEVMCGSGRTGTFFAHEQDHVLPDIVTMAKALGGGYQPIAATLVRGTIADAIASLPGGFEHGHTYTGHATACAAANAVQEFLDDQDLLDKVSAMGVELRDALQASIGDHEYVGDIRGRGLFAGIEIVADRETKEPFPADDRLASRIKAAAMDARLICYPGSGSVDGRLGAHILLAPPFIIERKHIDELIAKLGSVFAAVFDE